MDIPDFHEVLRDFGEEAGGALEGVAVAGVEAEFGVGEVEVVFAAGDADVEEAAFLFEAVGIFEAAAGGKHAIGEPDEEDDAPLEAFGLMQGGERDFLGVRAAGKGIGGFGAAEEGELGEEFLGRFKIPGEGLECGEVFAAGIVVRELFFHVVLVDCEEGAFHHRVGGKGAGGGREVGEGVDELLPAFGGFCRNFEREEAGEPGAAAQGAGREGPEVFGGLCSNSGQEADHAFEGDLVVRVNGKLEEGGDVFDVGLLEEPEPAGEKKWDPAFGEFHLHFHRVVVRAVEDGHLVKPDPLVTQLHHPLGYERRLLDVGVEANQCRAHRVRRPHGPESFWNLLFVSQDRGMLDLVSILYNSSRLSGYSLAQKRSQNGNESPAAPPGQ